MQAYSGKWWSKKYTKAFSRGNVWVCLPTNPSSEYTATAKIQYLGMYRCKQEERIPIQVSMQGTSASSPDYLSPPTTIQGTEAPHGTGTLQFNILTRDYDSLSGTYTLSNPVDHGQFELKVGDHHIEKCVIC